MPSAPVNERISLPGIQFLSLHPHPTLNPPRLACSCLPGVCGVCSYLTHKHTTNLPNFPQTAVLLGPNIQAQHPPIQGSEMNLLDRLVTEKGNVAILGTTSRNWLKKLVSLICNITLTLILMYLK